jgi:hypothetical protein
VCVLVSFIIWTGALAGNLPGYNILQAKRGQWKFTEMSIKVKGHMNIKELNIITKSP